MKNREAGFTLIEVLIAILLLSLVGLMIFMTLTFSSRQTLSADVRSTAESIARSEMEYIKTLPYDATSTPNPVYTKESMSDLGVNSNWDVTIIASRLDPKGDGTGNDEGIQKISVTVFNNGTSVLTVEGYKLN